MQSIKAEGRALGEQGSRAISGKSWKAKRTQSRAVDNTAADEDNAEFVPLLMDIMTKAKAPKPTGKLSDKEAWQPALSRRATARAKQSVRETLTRVEKTRQELSSFADRCGLHVKDL